MNKYLKIIYGILTTIAIAASGMFFSIAANHGFSVVFSIVLILFIASYLLYIRNKNFAIGMFIGLALVLVFFIIIFMGLSKMH